MAAVARMMDISLTQQSDPMDDPLTQQFWEKGRGLVPWIAAQNLVIVAVTGRDSLVQVVAGCCTLLQLYPGYNNEDV